MIISVEELRQYISTDEGDQALEARLQALELLIRGYTNNNFQVRGTGRIADVVGGRFEVEALHPYEIGDTLQISGSEKNDGLYTVKEADDHTFRVNEKTRDEIDLFVTMVEYSADVKMGVVEILRWKLRNEAANSGDKTQKDVQSETISRHSVTYAADASETDIDEYFGVPKKHTAFLRHYKKARFGQGLRV